VAEFRQKVFCGTYSKCGDLFMSAGQDQKIRLYDTTRGQFKLKKTIHARNVGWSVLDVALSPDNCHLIYSSWCDSIHQVSLFHEEEDSEHTALPLQADDNDRFCIFSLRFSANGDEILGGANNGYIYVYDRFAQTRSLRIDAHDDDVNAVAFVDTATHILASGGDDGLVKIWDRRSLKESNPVPVGIFAGHVDGITFIDAREDARHIITNSKDQSIKLWDLRKFANNRTIELTKDAIRHRAGWDYRWGSGRLPDSRSGSTKIDGDPSIMTYKGHSVFKTLIRCRFSPAHSTGQKFIYTGCGTGAIKSMFIHFSLNCFFLLHAISSYKKRCEF
jgi:WD repeat-containing protein 23